MSRQDTRPSCEHYDRDSNIPWCLFTTAPCNARKCGRIADEAGVETDVVDGCRVIAKAMNVMLCEVGQYKAKSSGTTVGFPDLVAIVSGKVVLIETKRAVGGVLSIGQIAFIERAAEQGVNVHVVSRSSDFVDIVNAARKPGCERRMDA